MQDGNVEAGSGENEREQETGQDSEDESRGIDLMASAKDLEMRATMCVKLLH